MVGTVIVSVILVCAVAGIIASMIKSRRSGSPCSRCGGGCPYCGGGEKSCHKEKSCDK